MYFVILVLTGITRDDIPINIQIPSIPKFVIRHQSGLRPRLRKLQNRIQFAEILGPRNMTLVVQPRLLEHEDAVMVNRVSDFATHFLRYGLIPIDAPDFRHKGTADGDHLDVFESRKFGDHLESTLKIGVAESADFIGGLSGGEVGLRVPI
jgi:hypothetical protein